MKKILALSLAAIMALGVLTGCGDSSSSGSGSDASVTQNQLEKIKASGKLVFATSPDYAPYEFVDLNKMGQGQEQYVGCDIDLANYIADALGVELVIEVMDYDAVLTAVAEGKCDIAISGIVSKPDRRTKMDFSNCYNPSEENNQTIMIRKSDADKFKTIEDFNSSDVKAAVQNGSLQQELATKNMPEAVQYPISKLTDGVMNLSTNKIDALVISTTTGQGFCDSYPDLMISGVYLKSDDDGVGIAIPKGENTELLEELNKIIDQVLEEGLYKQWEAEGKALADSQKKED